MFTLISSLVAGISAVIVAILSFIARKIATAVGSIILFGVITVAFIAAINTILQSVLSQVTVPVWIANSIGIFIPENFTVCVAAVGSARIARAAYDIAKEKLTLINNAS